MSEKNPLEIPGASLPFVSYEEDGVEYIEFDSSESHPPEPMVNFMKGFELIKGTEKKLVMINAQEPAPLYPRIATDLTWDVEVLASGDVKVVFSNKK
jgi:hypothetical protein